MRPNATLFPCPNSVLVHNTQWKYVRHGRKKIRGKILFNMYCTYVQRKVKNEYNRVVHMYLDIRLQLCKLCDWAKYNKKCISIQFYDQIGLQIS